MAKKHKVHFQHDPLKHISSVEQDYYDKHYGRLINGTIVGVTVTNEGVTDYFTQPIPVLIVTVGDKTYEVALFADAEGNDAGHADIHQRKN